MELMVRIQQTADRLFHRFGIRSVTMDDVAKEISVSKKTIYSCFRDKNELVLSIINEHVKENDDQINAIVESESNPIKRFAQIAAYIIQRHNQLNPALINDLKKYHPEAYEKISRFREEKVIMHVMRSITDGREQGLFRADFNDIVIAHAFSALTFAIFESESLAALNIDHKISVVEIIKYHLRSISTISGLEELEKVTWPNHSPFIEEPK
ncbi:MAG: TetR/AcrR family transcriptional regulator [Bacteroidota bacterium]|jgi:AcrR family transcriptional regulator